MSRVNLSINNEMLKNTSITLLTLLTLIFSCCSNPYKAYFISMQEQNPLFSYRFPIEPVLKSDEIKIYAVDDISTTEEALLENGYIPLGAAKFNSPQIDERRAINAAREIGASIVIIKSQYSRTKTETVPYSVRQPDQTTTIRNTRYKSDGKAIVKEQKITVEGEYQTQYIQQSTDYYDYQSVFWAKLKPPKIGIFVADLTNEQKQALQTNRGVEVKIVIKDTPAYTADILRGDILMKFNDERINDKKHFFQLVSKYKGQEITLNGLRDGAPFSIKLTINQ